MKSLSEKEVNKVFQIYKKQLITKLGTDVTTNHQLEKLGYKILGTRFKGVYSQDEFPFSKSGYFIVNNHKSSQPGEHWVAIYQTTHTIYIFDSFGRKSNKLLPMLYKNAKAYGKKVIDSDYDVDQKISTSICGPLSLAWLLTVKYVGIKNALKI